MLAENSVLAVNVKGDHKSVRVASRREDSTAPVLNLEKWSYESILRG